MVNVGKVTIYRILGLGCILINALLIGHALTIGGKIINYFSYAIGIAIGIGLLFINPNRN